MDLSPSPPSIYPVLAQLAAGEPPVALAVVLRAQGSTPCKAGAKALVDAQGKTRGTIGGGRVEAEAIRRCVAALEHTGPEVFDFRLDSGAFAAGEPICGGQMRVLIEPTIARHQPAFAASELARRERQRGLLLTAITHDPQPSVTVQFIVESALSSATGFPSRESLQSVLRSEGTERFVFEATAERPQMEVLVEALVPWPQLLIAGGGHVGQAVAKQAGLVGFEVTVLDDRPEFTHASLFPAGTTTRCGPIIEELAAFPWSADTYVVLVTRGHRQDAEALAACLRKPVAYLGMIGSRRKVAMLRKDFVESGRATAAELDHVYAPIGLDIGAVTVPEIATSIVAQLISVRRTGQAARMPGGGTTP